MHTPYKSVAATESSYITLSYPKALISIASFWAIRIIIHVHKIMVVLQDLSIEISIRLCLEIRVLI